MKVSVIAFTRNGSELCEKISLGLLKLGYEVEGYTTEKFSEEYNLIPRLESLSKWTEKEFKNKDGIIFIGACGIAVRGVAPYVKDKTTDPAIISIDEKGNFVVPLLSGHIGGANELAIVLSKIINGTAVISTATDLNDLFSVDSWASKNDVYIGNMNMAKKVSSALLNEEKIGIYSEFYIENNIPKGFVLKEKGDIGICITLNHLKKPFKNTLNLIPKIVSIGVGCRKGIPLENIEGAIKKVLYENEISINSIKNICSITLKENEEGILQFCEKYGIPFQVYTSCELSNVNGNFSSSAFVSSVTGVDNVCERAAVKGSHGGKLVVKKQINNSVTVAIAIANWQVKF